MEYGIVVLILYALIAITVGLMFNTLIISMIGTDKEFDDVVVNARYRFIIVLLLGMFWIITVPIFMYNNKIRWEDELWQIKVNHQII